MKMYKNKSRAGFTIVELMISTVIFSLVLVLCLTGMVQVSRAYYKGVTITRTQEAGRLLMDEISQNIKLSGSSIVQSTNNGGPQIDQNRLTAEGLGVFCAGNKKYTYALDRKVVTGSSNDVTKEIKNAIISEDAPCTDLLTIDTDILNQQVSGTTRSLLSENMRLTKFSITPYITDPAVDTKANSQLWKIDIQIAYGDQDLFSLVDPSNPYTSDYVDDQGANRVICKSNTGTEFCSIVEMSTIVSRRIS